MTRIIFFLLTFAVFPLGLQAQYANFDLNKYTNPEYQRKSLDILFNSSGTFYQNNTTTNNTLNGALSFSFNRTKLSRKLQETLNIGTVGNFNHFRFDTLDNQKTTNYAVGVFFDQKAHYYVDGDRFIEISPRVVAGYKNDRSNKASTDYHTRRNNNLRAEFEIDFGIGRGRIEDVTDARQAIYILEELNSKGILKKVLTTDEIDDFVHQISIIKNKRHYDAREKTIDELTYINNYLIAQHYIDTVNTAEYFFSLNDLWNNGDTQPRMAGHRFKFGLAPTYIFSQDNTSYKDLYLPENNLSDTKWGGTLYLDYTNEKAMNLKWQRSYNVGMRDGLYRWRSLETNQFLANIYGMFGMGYYLDTRTFIQGQVNQNFFWNHTPRSEKIAKENTLTTLTSLTLKGYYFISAQIKVFAEYRLSYSFSHFTEQGTNVNDRYPGSKFQVGLAYSIF